MELQYLGHIVTEQGVHPYEKEVEAIKLFPTPNCTKDVKSSLGLAGYYRKFITKFSHISAPLTRLLKKNVDWEWTQECEQSFIKLKSILSSEPLLQYPDFMQPFIVTTDASNIAIGCILSQGKIGEDKPIAYASRKLNDAETRYSTFDKEFLAIIWGCKHYRTYLLGRSFLIVTDHKP